MSIYRGRNTTEFYLASLLYDSIEDIDKKAFTSLIKDKNADANMVLPRRGIAPFHLVVASENEEFAKDATKLILQHGGNPNVRSDEGLTPLHLAAAWGRKDLVELLLNCGADPDLDDNTYKTPVQYALEEGYPDIVNIINQYKSSEVASYFTRQKDDSKCHITLDKVLVNNGFNIGEYEIVKTDSKKCQENGSIDLKVLPVTDLTDYVQNWCNTLNDDATTENSCNFAASLKSPFVTTRRPNYNNHTNHSEVYNSSDFSLSTSKVSGKCSVRSRESGIATLPSSTFCDDVDERPKRKTSKDTTSDYFTCTEVSEVIDELAEDYLNIAFVNSAIDSESSFVSVSEVHKYFDSEEGVTLFEKRILPSSNLGTNLNETENFTVSSKSSKLSSLPTSFDYDTDSLRRELTNVGFEPGPITKTTKRLYLRKLRQYQKYPQEVIVVQDNKKVYSHELQKTLRAADWISNPTPYRVLEDQVSKQFASPDPSKRWREGLSKTSFNYLLLDPRVTKNLPCRSESLAPEETWRIFLDAIFYVGKGKRSRPYQHLYDAVSLHKKSIKTSSTKKLQRILDIWNENQGVVCLHVFQNIIPVEAYTREGAMISALKLENIENAKAGEFYGLAATWTNAERQKLGTLLLHKAMRIFLCEGERQLSPNDID